MSKHFFVQLYSTRRTLCQEDFVRIWNKALVASVVFLGHSHWQSQQNALSCRLASHPMCGRKPQAASETLVGRRKRKGSLGRSLSRVRKEATGTAKSALGLVPVLGTALGAVDTTRKALRTAKATRQAGRVLQGKVRRRSRRKSRKR